MLTLSFRHLGVRLRLGTRHNHALSSAASDSLSSAPLDFGREVPRPPPDDSDDVWHIYNSSKTAALAGALFGRAVGWDTSVRGLPTVEAEGRECVSRAMNALALCNRYLQSREELALLAFVPILRTYVEKAGPHAGSEAGAFPNIETVEDTRARYAVQLHLRYVQPREPTGDEDVLRVASQTNAQRLAGRVDVRWRDVESGIGESNVVLNAMGPKSIDIMVCALATAWLRHARSYEGGYDVAGFSCLPTHLAIPGRAADDQRYSGIQCVLCPPVPE